jgi:diguanylate cyclase (GGDEF)-like protein/PAS domain S-box-containing protein
VRSIKLEAEPKRRADRLAATEIAKTNCVDANEAPIDVLLIEANSSDADLIQQAMVGTTDRHFRVKWVTKLASAFEQLGSNKFAVVLLDLALPDAQGVDVFGKVLQAAPNALILIVSSASDVEAARVAVQHGAHDYLIKGHVDSHWLPRVLRYLIDRKLVQDALQTSEARFRAMSDASPLGIFVSDESGNCVYTNAAYQKISGLSFEQTLGTNWITAIHPDERQRVLGEWLAAVRDSTTFHAEFRFLRNDGSVVWTRDNSAAIGDGMQRHGRIKTVEDITERKLAEDALFEEKERAQVTLNSIGDAVLTTDLLGNITYLNLVAETMTGWSSEEALGRPLAEVFKIIDGNNREPAINPALRAIKENMTVGLAADCVLIRRDGFESSIEDSAAPIHNRDGQVAGAVLVFHDVSKSRAMALKMAHFAKHDFLTDLPNRVLLTERLTQAIGLAHRHGKQLALLFLDLDDFKHINDSIGHMIGDQLLQSVANRLTMCVRNTDTVCRQGGDEFVILLAEIDQPQHAASVAEKLLVALAVPHRIGGHELHVTSSIGISIYPDDGIGADDVIQNADTAMYYAKTSGRNNYKFYTAEMNARAVQRLFIESSLRHAMARGEFVLHYQPQVDLVSGAMTGAEALIRWQDPDRGLIYPEQFVSIAEDCGLIVPIGRSVLREACMQVRKWLDAGLPAVPVAVNISAVEFRHKNFLEGVGQILKDTGIAPCYLELELTESVLMEDAESSVARLAALKNLGVQLAIDDFGTGYSSLNYLKRFPIDILKIDQSFVRDVATNSNDAAIVNAVIGMGKGLKQRVIAEGVETPGQLAFLRMQLCDTGQGYLFSHPLPVAAFENLLVTGMNQAAI